MSPSGASSATAAAAAADEPEVTPAGPAGSAGSAPRATLRRGGVLFAATHFAGMAVGFVGSALMVRVAPRAAVASYLLLLQAITAVALALQLGLAQAVLRFGPLTRGQGGRRATRLLARRLYGIQITAWLAAVPLLVLLWPGLVWRLDAAELVPAWPWLVAAAMLISFNSLADAQLRVARLYTASALLSHLAVRALVAAAFVALFVSGASRVSWHALATIYLGAQLATAAGYLLALPATRRDLETEPRAAQEPPGVKTNLGTTSAMGLRSAVAVFMASCDLWILSWARTHQEVAVYGVMLSVLQLMGVLPTIANLVIPQEFALLHADGRRAELEWLARTSSTVVAILSLGTLAALALFGRPLLDLAFGEKYAAGWSILLILAVGRFWDAACGSAGYMLQMTGSHVRLLALTVTAALANVALSLALARPYGGHGVALANAASLVALNTAMVATANRRVGVKTFVYLAPRQWLRVAGTALGARRRQAAAPEPGA